MSFESRLPDPDAKRPLDKLGDETKRKLAGLAIPGNPADSLAADPSVTAFEHDQPFGSEPIDQQTEENRTAFYIYMADRIADVLTAHQAQGGGSSMTLDALLVAVADITGRSRPETMSAILWANWNDKIGLVKMPGSGTIIAQLHWGF